MNVKQSIKAAYQSAAEMGNSVAVRVGAVGTGLMVLGQSAHAALPAAVGTTVTDISANGQGIFDLIFPVIGTFLGLAIVIKLFKRFGNKL